MAQTAARSMALCAEQEALIGELAGSGLATGLGRERRCASSLCTGCPRCGATACCATGSAARGDAVRALLGLLWQEVALAREGRQPQAGICRDRGVSPLSGTAVSGGAGSGASRGGAAHRGGEALTLPDGLGAVQVVVIGWRGAEGAA